VQQLSTAAQLLHHAIHRGEIAADRSEVAHLSLSSGFCHHYVDRFLVDIETHHRGTLRHGPASLRVALRSRAGFVLPRA
jgi:hypothetical protein